jgi:cardiolipin synthase (CMP-forming)
LADGADLLNLPNILTLARFVLTPFIVLAIHSGRHVEALVLFALAAITDYLDGASARRFHISTPAGAYLDPLADKFLLSGVYFALAWARIVPWWLVGIVFGRDIFILAGAGIVMWSTPVRRFPPSVWGKVSTFFQLVNAVVWMARNALHVWVLDAAAALSLWLCVGFTLWSGLDYARRGFRILRTH